MLFILVESYANPKSQAFPRRGLNCVYKGGLMCPLPLSVLCFSLSLCRCLQTAHLLLPDSTFGNTLLLCSFLDECLSVVSHYLGVKCVRSSVFKFSSTFQLDWIPQEAPKPAWHHCHVLSLLLLQILPVSQYPVPSADITGYF